MTCTDHHTHPCAHVLPSTLFGLSPRPGSLTSTPTREANTVTIERVLVVTVLVLLVVFLATLVL